MADLPLWGSAFIAGILMFLAPCTLPIVPGYLAFIAGGSGRGRLVMNAAAFVLGFSAVFILFGLFAGQLGHFIGPWRPLLPRVAGAILVLFGLTMLGVRMPALSGERHFSLPRFLSVGRPESSLFIGALFALGWSPCIGPILGTILLLASTTDPLQGAVLLGIFSLGLGTPFILTAVFMERASALFARSSTLTAMLSRIGGVLLVAVGAVMLLGQMGYLVGWGLNFFDGFYRALLPYM